MLVYLLIYESIQRRERERGRGGVRKKGERYRHIYIITTSACVSVLWRM